LTRGNPLTSLKESALCAPRDWSIISWGLMITFNQENWKDCKGEIAPLAREHFKECHIADGKEFSIDEPLFDALSDSGCLHVTTVRAEALVGYVINIISRHLLYSSFCSHHAGWYVAPDHRGIGGALLGKSEEYLKERGIERMYGAHTVTKDASKIFERQGWDLIEHHYAKWVK
jgi:GNAT superfamily N-acetyltransferase